ncbi:MAG: hypothetical protein K6G71_01825 [Clostridiales bacterium]|nr:hypothetical protein [Clostridiales bacterium]
MKRILALSLAIIMTMSLVACGHEHIWTEATCTTPKTCTECGATEGEPLGHEWKDATCTEPKTCARCNATEGEPLGHDWKDATCTEPRICSRCGEKNGSPLGHKVEEWNLIQEPTCSKTGTESGVCTVCNKTVTRNVDKIEHTPGDWEITIAATAKTQGTREKRCIVCGKTLETEKFSMTEEEIREQYIKECQSIPYKSLERTPDDYEGEKIKFSGYVVQVCSEASSPLYYSTYRVATSGKYDNVIYVKVDNYGSGSRILEDDYLTFYGTYDGLYSYKAVRGNEITIPSMTAEYIK